MNKKNRYRDFLEVELPSLIVEGVGSCFDDMDEDPEVVWGIFRNGLRKIKKRHIELYLDYMESDVEDELPKSEITKWREEQALKEAYKKSIEGFDLPDGF